ncbi:MAG: redox-sensing transcriptional repressor Rex [Clostridia bacterium]
MDKKIISEAVIKRLPRYYRQLKLLQEQGKDKVSSHMLAQMLDITASQVRQDFCNFGGFGQQGYGYDIAKLVEELSGILGLDRAYNLIVVGAGNIGHALAGYQGFAKYGFTVQAMFDVARFGEDINSVHIYSMDELANYVNNNRVDMAVIATPKAVAQEVADRLVDLGIKTIWNFAPLNLTVANDVAVENISMSESLLVLSYRANNIHNN